MKRRWEPGALPNRQADSSKRRCKRKSAAPNGATTEIERIFSDKEPLTPDSVFNAVPHNNVSRKRKHDVIEDDNLEGWKKAMKAGNADSMRRKRKHYLMAGGNQEGRRKAVKAGNAGIAIGAQQQPPPETHGKRGTIGPKEGLQDTPTPQAFSAFNFWRNNPPILLPEELNVPGNDAVEGMDQA